MTPRQRPSRQSQSSFVVEASRSALSRATILTAGGVWAAINEHLEGLRTRYSSQPTYCSCIAVAAICIVRIAAPGNPPSNVKKSACDRGGIAATGEQCIDNSRITPGYREMICARRGFVRTAVDFHTLEASVVPLTRWTASVIVCWSCPRLAIDRMYLVTRTSAYRGQTRWTSARIS